MTTALEGGEGSASRPGRSLPRERPGTHCIGGWVGPRAGLDRCGKSRPPPGLDPRTVQPVASRYTDYATPHTEDTVQTNIVILEVGQYNNQATSCSDKFANQLCRNKLRFCFSFTETTSLKEISFKKQIFRVTGLSV